MSVCHGERPSRIPHLKKHPRFRSISSPPFLRSPHHKGELWPGRHGSKAGIWWMGRPMGRLMWSLVMAGHGKPAAMSGFNMFLNQPRHDHFTARTAALSSHERWPSGTEPAMETFRWFKIFKAESPNAKTKKVVLTSISSYFSMVLSWTMLNLFHAVRSPPADALPSLFGTSFVLARKAWDWTGILRCHVFFGSGIAVLEKGDHRW